MIAVNKILKVLREKDVGSIGIGAMIVFIAMVLVAGIAASVLIQTANRLETQAMKTGAETTAEVATGIQVFDIEGYCHGSGATRDIKWMAIGIKPRAGSASIDLSNTVIELSDSATKLLLSYNSADTQNFASAVSSTNGRIFSNWTITWDMDNEEFGIIVLEDADTSISVTTPVINRGDSVLLCVNTTACFSGIDPRDDVWGQIIPEEGAFGPFSFRVPSSLSDTVYDLY